ncbi:unnamed protein product [Paramecium octaurelia]|uniref:Uncharacterized protein n=1 Tax=Paramecium octaurelia TaxID=43137 RepID=A0A8S1X561_PAROT|nr:unnamed protein product [Paramecium octaurelia]
MFINYQEDQDKIIKNCSQFYQKIQFTCMALIQVCPQFIDSGQFRCKDAFSNEQEQYRRVNQIFSALFLIN